AGSQKLESRNRGTEIRSGRVSVLASGFWLLASDFWLLISPSPLNPNRIRDERSRGVVDGLGVRDRDGFAERSLQAIDCSLLRLNFDDPDGVSVIISCLAYRLVGGNPHQIRAVVEYRGRREEDESEDHNDNHVVGPRAPLKGP